MKQFILFLIMGMALLSSCSLTDKLINTDVRPLVNQPMKNMESMKVLENKPMHISDAKRSNEQVRTKDLATGEDLVTVELSEVTVVARTKTVPERFGLVNLDFVITVPKRLIDKRWMVTLSPRIERGSGNENLEDIVINGEIYRLYQKKGEALYGVLSDRYNHFRRDTANIWDYFYTKYNLHYNTDARLDTIVEAGSNFHYHYSQEIKTDDSKSIDLFLNGNVFGLDKSTYVLPKSDTITYFVSSMIQFIDQAPRYKRKIIERHAEAHFSAHITFPTGKAHVDEDLHDNGAEITKVQDIIKRLTWSSEFVIDSINMTASSSPEGTWATNELLAKRRALALKDYFGQKMDDKKGVDTLFNAKWIAEDWNRISRMIGNSSRLPDRSEILEIIENVLDPDKRELEIKTKYPVGYAYMRDSLYPQLRTVEFQFNLHRSGMTKDTIHTTEPDTLYEIGRDLLKARKYKDALEILIEYDDYNTAIAYMSLGYDTPAYNILAKQEESANSEYLLSVLSARLGKEDEAVKRYLRSCELDESKAWRGALDPEINTLIKKYHLNTNL